MAPGGPRRPRCIRRSGMRPTSLTAICCDMRPGARGKLIDPHIRHRASVAALSVVSSPPFMRPIRRPRLSPDPGLAAHRSTGSMSSAPHLPTGSGLFAAPSVRSPLFRGPRRRPAPPRSARRLPVGGSAPTDARCRAPPPLPTGVEGPCRAILRKHVTPSQPIALNEDYVARAPPVTDPRLAVAFRGRRRSDDRPDKRPQPFHLRDRQPKKGAHQHPVRSAPCITRA